MSIKTNDELVEFYKNTIAPFKTKDSIVTYSAIDTDYDHHIAVCYRCETVKISKIPPIKKFPCNITYRCSNCGLEHTCKYNVGSGLHNTLIQGGKM